MKKTICIHGKGTEELLIAHNSHKLLQFFKTKDLPNQEFAFGSTALTVSARVTNEENLWVSPGGGNRRVKQTLNGEIIVYIDSDKVLLEMLNLDKYRELKSGDKNYSHSEMQERLAVQENKDHPELTKKLNYLVEVIKKEFFTEVFEVTDEKYLRFVPYGSGRSAGEKNGRMVLI